MTMLAVLFSGMIGSAGAAGAAMTQGAMEPAPGSVRVLDAPPSPAFNPAVPLPVKPRLSLPTLEAKAIEQARRWQTTGVAKPVLSDDGVLLYPYGEYMPTMVCAILRSCIIDLEPGESITGIKPGDKVRWKFSKVVSGEGATEQTHIIVKPIEEGIETNVAISTNRRLYDVLLRAGSADSMIHRMGFYYPSDMVGEWSAQQKVAAEHDASVVDTLGKVDVEAINFAYSWSANRYAKKQPMAPVRVFDDGHQTYIQFDPAIKDYEAPTLMVRAADGQWQIVNYRMVGTYYKVDRLFNEALLALGTGRKAAQVTIRRESRP